jgi:prophage regulatory protein
MISGRFLSIREVVQRTGLGRTTIWRLEKAGKFPQRVRISAGRVAWCEAEVEAWRTGLLASRQAVLAKDSREALRKALRPSDDE